MTEMASWQWKDERGLWHSFNALDSKIIESAFQSGEDELELVSSNRTYMIDFNSMQKIYDDTGNTFPVQRKLNPCTSTELVTRSNIPTVDPRSEFIYLEKELSGPFIKFIFNILNEIYNNSAGFSVRFQCLNAILRILYFSPRELLTTILQNQSVSSSIATMLASSDMRIVVSATQMCHILMQKLPEIFSVYFQREGVVYQIKKLYSDENRFTVAKVNESDGKSSSSNNTIVISNQHSLVNTSNPQLIKNPTVESVYSSLEYVSSQNNASKTNSRLEQAITG